MTRLSDHDINFGPFTFGKWFKTFSCYVSSYDEAHSSTHLIVSAFGFVFRVCLWNWICRPWKERWVECNWDEETVKRLGRSGYWAEHPRRFGLSLSDMGNGYDFFQLFFGAQVHDNCSWSCFLPWKQRRFVRHSIYTPTGEHFWTESRTNNTAVPFEEYQKQKDACPKSRFAFTDHDGERIIATCMVEEREWHKGSGWFKWLKYFSKPKISRTLDLSFSSEVGPEKGSWKGGTIGHGADIKPGETPESAFRRYCQEPHRSRGKSYTLKFEEAL